MFLMLSTVNRRFPHSKGMPTSGFDKLPSFLMLTMDPFSESGNCGSADGSSTIAVRNGSRGAVVRRKVKRHPHEKKAIPQLGHPKRSESALSSSKYPRNGIHDPGLNITMPMNV